MEEYIILCKTFEDMENFYDDMETPGGTLYIPDRVVECSRRKGLSKSTVYLLENDEAEKIKKDSRVFSITKYNEFLNSKVIRPTGWTQTSNDWDKEWYGSETGTEKNWGLKRCTQLDNDTNWGYYGELYGGANTISGTVTSMYSGYNVDVVIIDGHIDANHPEFSVNPDGTGGSRVVHLDWDVFTNIVNFGTTFDLPTYNAAPTNPNTANSYIYGDGIGSTFTDYGSDHGMHVAGTVAGNTQGWARGATIYNISPYYDGGDPNAVPNPNSPIYRNNIFDYVRAFHNNKPINPITGRRNPTIANASYGGYYGLSSDLCGIYFRGTEVTSNTATNTVSELISWGLPNFSDPTSKIYTSYHETYSAFEHTEIANAVDDGIVLTVAAGNALDFYALPNDQDYDNYINYQGYFNTYQFYYCRGEEKAYGGEGGLAIGNMDAYYLEIKASSSARGPGIDCWAPGSTIMSSVHQIGDEGNSGKVQDPRNSSYYLKKQGGTSMAAPQVAGVLACLAEQNPNLNTSDAKEWIQYYSNKNDIYPYASSNGFSDVYWLGNTSGESNRLLYLKQTRYDEGQNQFVYKGIRPTNGVTYPRRRYQNTIARNNIEKWYPVYIGYASQSPAHYKTTGVDANGVFNNRDSSVSAININVGEAIAFNNFWGSGAISTSHPMRISSTVGGVQHPDVTCMKQDSYTFIPSNTGTYYYYCIYHQTMYGQIIVS